MMALLPVWSRDARLAPVLAERWHLAVVGYAQGVTVLQQVLPERLPGVCLSQLRIHQPG